MPAAPQPSDEGGATPAMRRIGGIAVRSLTRDAAVAAIVAAVAATGGATFAFCNAHTVNLARRLPAFRRALATATVFNDGVGMDIGMRLLGQERFAGNLNGTDLTPALLAALPAETPVFLLGSPAGVADAAQEVLGARYPHLRFVGAEHGWFSADEEARIAGRIRASGARLVLVGMGQPRQELWAERHREALDAVLLCIGAYLDFATGRFRRAPALVRSLRLEWAYRLMLEPRRLAGRYLLGNGAFLAGVVADRLKGAR